ncbi:MAG: restriction endonuclease subunit S, partial [Gammaproteobacteria bacterium]|nr:restriction endonuclease subunit S [Gammaproteobacteria bacterium]
YNKSATKAYPQGFIARYDGRERAAVPNSIFTCFRLDNEEVHPIFLENLFISNLHRNWLRGRIAVGARAHGSLNVSDDDLMALPVPLPPVARRREEQQKIADCLMSLDEVIVAQGRKVEALKAHKRGLMQQLFPREGETRPRLRFPEFRNAPEWLVARVCDLFETSSGGTPDRKTKEYWGRGVPWVTTSLVGFNVITDAEEFVSEAGLKNSSAREFPKGTVIVAMYGQGKTRGQVALLGVDAATNQACAAILPSEDIASEFVFFNLCGRYDELRSLSNSGGQENLSQGLIRELPFRYPKSKSEQAAIIDCFTSLENQITAETARLAALKTHKQGLMQQLFPAPEATGA